jgi:hypothetical protein
MTNQRDQIKLIIQRFDNYISGANAKGNFLLAINTFLCGIIISSHDKLNEIIIHQNDIIYLNIILIILLVLSICTTFFVLRAVYPFLLSGNSSKDSYHSHIFFNSVAEFNTGKEYYKSIEKQSDENVDEDMAIQAYCLAKGLKNKYAFLEIAMKFVYAELFMLFTLLITIIILSV